MTKPFLPHVSIETIQEIGLQASKDLDSLFTEMSAANPELYRFVYEFHQRKETTKTTMLGVIAGIYCALELEGKKLRKSKGRLRHK